MSRFALVGGRLMLDELGCEDDFVDDHVLLIEHGRILDVVPDTVALHAVPTRLPAGAIVAPGLIDIQVNGAGGVLFNDAPAPETMAVMAGALRGCGVTGFLPTLITDTPARMAEAVAAICAVPPGTGVLGVHFEGPFLNPDRAGAHDPAHLRPMTAADERLLLDLAADRPDLRVLLTLAPERVDPAAIARLVAGGVIVSAGHSAATPSQLDAACAAGLRGFTHLFNAMPPLVNRAPGPAVAALLDRQSWCGIIADGVHVHPALLRLAIAAKPRGRVLLVSDAMPPLGTDQTRFELAGRTVFRDGGRLTFADGTLAGADLDLGQAVRNAVAMLGLSPAEALRMASRYPAEFLGCTAERGRIAAGLYADLIVLDAELRVRQLWQNGVRIARTPK